MKKVLCFLSTFFIIFTVNIITMYGADEVKIDKSKIQKGVVSVSYAPAATKTVKVEISKGDTKYTYDLTNSESTAFPLQMGDGEYKLSVIELISAKKGVRIANETFSVTGLKDEDIYTNSIQNVNFNDQMKAIRELKALTADVKTDKEKVNIIYDYMISHITYDYDKAEKLASGTGYLPVIDDTYASHQGICYDYSSLFASLLRNMDIPVRLQMGYYTEIDQYHAWNQVKLDGKWVTIDTTYDAQAKSYKINYSQTKDDSKFNVLKQY